MLNLPRKITISEVGPRDGLQMAKTRMSSADKVRWIAALHAAGIGRNYGQVR